MPRPRRPVSPVPEGPAEEDQLQTWMGLRMEEERRRGGGGQKTRIIFRGSKVWEGGKMEETEGDIFFMRVGDKGVGERGEKQNSVGERRDVRDFK